MNTEPPPPRRPFGWLLALGVALVFVSVIAGVIALGLVARHKQRYREPVLATPPIVTNQAR